MLLESGESATPPDDDGTMTISDSGSDSGGVGADGGGSDPGADVVDPVDRFVRMMDEWIDDCDLEAPRPVLLVDDEFGSGPEALRIGEPEGPLPVDLVEALLARAIHAVEAMQFTKPDSFDRSTLTLMAQGVERLRRQIEAVAVEGADHVDTSNPFRSDGVFTAKNWLQHRLQLSGPEAHRRVQSARMGRRLGHWANAARSGLVGIAQSQLMARVASNPRLDPDVLWRDSWDLLHDAIELSYPMFEQRIRAWEALADPVGAHALVAMARAAADQATFEAAIKGNRSTPAATAMFSAGRDPASSSTPPTLRGPPCGGGSVASSSTRTAS
jgi:hypothetical protein